MPSNLPPRKTRRFVRIRRQSIFPYIMLFILSAIIVIVGSKPRPIEDLSASVSRGK
ncbi:hypothetical protein [Lichenifustis flavocetrariae]|uniref:hypothetical protein n=1 Tax=Lichenifustis flavocetrariae TaxID=2949735 RepID=UPI0024A67356|nr:hypothetical protein [Lichenifustis flavocetrariae]